MTEEEQTEILLVLGRVYKLWQSIATIIDEQLKFKNEVRENRDNWDQICSSSDAINDTTRAIGSYVESDYPDDVGLKYLFIYGLLQALYIQQDAVENLFKTLRKCYPQSKEFGYDRSDKLTEIRFLRNETTGHPTGTKSGIFYLHRSGVRLVNGILQGFVLLKKEENQFLSVDLSSVLREQAIAIESDLESFKKGLDSLP